MNFPQPGPSIRFSNGRMVSKVIIPNSFPQFTLKCTKLFWVSHQRRSTCNFLPKYSASSVLLTERFCRILSSRGLVFFQLSTRSDVWSNGQKVWCEKPQIYRNGLHHGIIFFWFVFALHFTPWLHTANILPWMVLFFACISISQCLTGSAIVLYW